MSSVMEYFIYVWRSSGFGMSNFENFGERNFRIFINAKNIAMS